MKPRAKIDGVFTKEYVAYHSMLRRVAPLSLLDKQRVKGTRYEYLEIEFDFLGEKGFEAFYKEVGPAPGPEFMLDRENNNKGYLRGNLRWVSKRTSNLNRGSAFMITAFGKTQNLSDWASETGIHRATITRRINLLGWSVEDALTLPSHSRYKR